MPRFEPTPPTGLAWEHISNPAYTFNVANEYVQTFSDIAGVEAPNPHTNPAAYAAHAGTVLQPRYSRSAFNVAPATPEEEEEFAVRYAQADKSLAPWVNQYEDLIRDTADALGVIRRDIGTTFEYPEPQGTFDMAVALEGANDQDYLRSAPLADALRDGRLHTRQVLVAVTNRKVGKGNPDKPQDKGESYGLRDELPDIRVGYGVGALTVARLYNDYHDVFTGEPGDVSLDLYKAQTPNANGLVMMDEIARTLRPRTVLQTGSRLYGPWMSMNLENVKQRHNLEHVAFAAGPDDPKASRNLRIIVNEIAQTLGAAGNLGVTLAEKRAA